MTIFAGSLDELQDMVIPFFERIENRKVKRLEFAYQDHPWGTDQLQRIVHIAPGVDEKIVRIVFPMPDFRPQYKTAVGSTRNQW